MTVRAAAVIPAAGAGLRLGGVPKSFVPLAGRPILQHSIEPFLADPRVEHVVVALAADAAADTPEWLRALAPRVRCVQGGETRGDSVHAALAAVPASANVILVHDAARPLLTRALVRRAIDAAAAGRSVVAAVPVTDTVQQVDPAGTIIATPDRDMLRNAQTPQAFPSDVIRAAYARARADGIRATDDAALVIRYGGTVSVIEGEVENLKITVLIDLAIAEALLHARSRT